METLSLRQIETFYWVVKLGSFQAAADYLNTTQPGVSTRIRELERGLGVELFDRSARSAKLTGRGRDLVDHAAMMLTLTRDIRQRVASKSAFTGLVRLGAADTIALTWLPALLEILGERYPSLEIELEIDLTVNLLGLLRDHKIDLALLVGPIAEPEIAAEPLGRVELAWMAHPSIAMPDKPLSARDLSAWPIISHTRGTHQHIMIEQWFHAQGARPGRISSCSSLATIIKLVVGRIGISVLAPETLESEIAAGDLRVIRTTRPLPANDFVIAYPTKSFLAAGSAITKLAQELAARHKAFHPIKR